MDSSTDSGNPDPQLEGQGNNDLWLLINMTLGWKLGRCYATDLFCNVDGHTTEESALTRLSHKKQKKWSIFLHYSAKSQLGNKKKGHKKDFVLLLIRLYQYR
jgi:hypothetical protein